MEPWLPMGGLRNLEPKESEIENACLHYFSAQGLFIWKNPRAGFFDAKRGAFRKHISPFAINGSPDAIIVKNGVFVGIEFKTKAGRLSDAQNQFAERLRKAKGLYFVCRSLDDARNIYLALQNI